MEDDWQSNTLSILNKCGRDANELKTPASHKPQSGKARQCWQTTSLESGRDLWHPDQWFISRSKRIGPKGNMGSTAKQPSTTQSQCGPKSHALKYCDKPKPAPRSETIQVRTSESNHRNLRLKVTAAKAPKILHKNPRGQPRKLPWSTLVLAQVPLHDK
eukprot:5531261-Amphidinium_carterae.1